MTDWVPNGIRKTSETSRVGRAEPQYPYQKYIRGPRVINKIYHQTKTNTMKFLPTVLFALATSYVAAAPAYTSDEEVLAAPTEAIIGQFSLSSDEYPVIVSQNEQTYIVLLNSTIMDEAYADTTKRDAKWGWIRFRKGQPVNKREAEADAKWGWIRFRKGQPVNKRDAGADAEAYAEAEADAYETSEYEIGEPAAKRDAEADAKWGWIRFRKGQPVNKREADAEAKWGWIRFRKGQPVN